MQNNTERKLSSYAKFRLLSTLKDVGVQRIDLQLTYTDEEVLGLIMKYIYAITQTAHHWEEETKKWRRKYESAAKTLPLFIERKDDE